MFQAAKLPTLRSRSQLQFHAVSWTCDAIVCQLV